MSHQENASPVVTIQHFEISMLLSCNRAQSRVALNKMKIKEYSKRMRDGVEFAAVVLFFDGTNYHLASGAHRLNAALDAKFTTFPAEVRKGSEREAMLFSIEDNAHHGAALTMADRRNAATILLRDSEWGQWGDNEIVRRTGLCPATVKKIRDALFPTTVTPQVTERKATRNGKTYTIKVNNIGKKKEKKKKTAAKLANIGGVKEPVAALELPTLEPVVPAAQHEPVIEPELSEATTNDFAREMVKQVTSAEEKGWMFRRWKKR